MVRHAVVEPVGHLLRSGQRIPEVIDLVAVAKHEARLEDMPASDIRHRRPDEHRREKGHAQIRVGAGVVHGSVDQVAQSLFGHRDHQRVGVDLGHVTPLILVPVDERALDQQPVGEGG